MAKRKIIEIDEAKCNGCGLCIPNCPEGAIQIIDGKARLINDLFCDGLGACLGYCPRAAITIEEREAEKYDEKKVMENIVRQGKDVIRAHLEHLKGHNQTELIKQAQDYLKEKGIQIDLMQTNAHSCPGAKIMDFKKEEPQSGNKRSSLGQESQLRTWPVQIMLVPPVAPYLQEADLLIAADCVPFAYANFHQDLLKGRVLLVGCPKLDMLEIYKEKITHILKNNNIKSITYAHMEVPCCFGLVNIIQSAISLTRKSIPFKEVVISIRGEKLT